jgi:hypothetical protein
MLLSSCGSIVSRACPVPVEYSDQDQDRAADELTAPPAKPTLGRMMADYGRLRDQARDC